MTTDPTLLAHTPQTFLIPAPALPATPMPTLCSALLQESSAQTTTQAHPWDPSPAQLTSQPRPSSQPDRHLLPISPGAQASCSAGNHMSPVGSRPSKTPPARPPRTWLIPSHTHETEGYLSAGQEALRVGSEERLSRAWRAALKRTTVSQPRGPGPPETVRLPHA